MTFSPDAQTLSPPQVSVETSLDLVGLSLAGARGLARRATAAGLLGGSGETRRRLLSLSSSWPSAEPSVELHWSLFDWPLPQPARPAPARRQPRPGLARRKPHQGLVSRIFARLLNVR